MGGLFWISDEKYRTAFNDSNNHVKLCDNIDFFQNNTFYRASNLEHFGGIHAISDQSDFEKNEYLENDILNTII